MAKFSIEVAIAISFVVGLILPYLGLGIFSIIIMGFLATYLTDPQKSSYMVGGLATGLFGFVFFIYSFFTGPTLPYVLPSALNLGLMVALGGYFNLLLTLLVTLLIYGVFGLLGGYIAAEFFLGKKEKVKEIKHTTQRRTLKRVK